MPREEIQQKMSPLACRRINVYNPNSRKSPMVLAGKTRAGTDVAYNRRFFEADKIIITGWGIGASSFVTWLHRNASAGEMEAKLQEKFQFGGPKAYFLSRLTEKADVLLVSSIPEKKLRDLFVKPAAHMQDALKMAHDKVGPKPLTYILPQGGLVFPWVKG